MIGNRIYVEMGRGPGMGEREQGKDRRDKKDQVSCAYAPRLRDGCIYYALQMYTNKKGKIMNKIKFPKGHTWNYLLKMTRIWR